MAVVQISRIQVRRGQANQGTGIPQLAGGEFGWAVDTQELYIGNGAVSEGAPYVGNTKVLTEHDNFFDLVETYQYRPGSINTVSNGVQILRSLQERLDDRVSVRSFGAIGNGSDATERLQKALLELYFRDDSKSDPQSRVILHVEAGEYVISSTVYIPPYATIVGAGKDKTIFKKTGDFPMFETAAAHSIYTSSGFIPGVDGAYSYDRQPRGIFLAGCTLLTTDSSGVLLNLKSVDSSYFSDIKFAGPRIFSDTVYDPLNNYPVETSTTNPGLYIDSHSDMVTSTHNKFINCDFVGLAYGIESDHYITHNLFENCNFKDLIQGIKVGVSQTIGQSPAENNTIRMCTFNDIEQHAINFVEGTSNSSVENTFLNVGNNGGSEREAAYSVINFVGNSNISVDDYFERTYNQTINQEYIASSPYVPEISGPIFLDYSFAQQVQVQGGQNIETMLFRVPADVNKTVDIDYTFAVGDNFVRTGTLKVTINRGTNAVLLEDDYSTVGAESLAEGLVFTSGTLINIDNVYACKINYIADGLSNGTFRFKLKSRSTIEP